MDRSGTLNRQPSAILPAVVHYICRTMATTPERLGAVKLHKILWFLDIKSYRLSGTQLTEASYCKMPFGPFADQLDDTIAELERARRLSVLRTEQNGYQQTQFIGHGEPDVSNLTERERRWLDQEIEHVCHDHTASSISDRSHDDLWQGTALGASMPVGAAAVRFAPPNDAAISWEKETLIKLNL